PGAPDASHPRSRHGQLWFAVTLVCRRSFMLGFASSRNGDGWPKRKDHIEVLDTSRLELRKAAPNV
ncbi:MAG TPA: hypothetical protein VF772_07640, partial [Terriglobales bacterium]